MNANRNSMIKTAERSVIVGTFIRREKFPLSFVKNEKDIYHTDWRVGVASRGIAEIRKVLLM